MPLRKIIFPIFFSLVTIMATGQKAPVTTIGVVTNATPGSYTFPVTVTGFINVGQFTLTLNYSTSNLTYTGYIPNPAFPTMTVTHTTTGTLGKIQVNFSGVAANFTLPDLSALVSFNFTYITGTSYLTWNYSNSSGNICRYKTYSGGSTYVTLNDGPKSSYYIHGGIGNRGAPITSAASISNAVPGAIAVPVTVSNFNSIQVFNLNLEYDQNVLTFQNISTNPIFSTGSVLYGASIGPNGKYILTINCPGPGPYTLPDGSTLFTISFTYSNTAGTWSELTWYDNGSSCDFSSEYNRLIDNPTDNYYHNGKIYTKIAPIVSLPSVSDALPMNSLSVPVETTGFSDIYSFTLSFEYDTAALVYNSFLPNPELSSMTVVNNSPVGSKRKLVMAWTGASAKTLPDGSALAELYFTCKTAPTDLTWVTGDAISCRFNDAAGKAYYDLPKPEHYVNGMVSSQLAPVTIAGYASPTPGQQVTLPVVVTRFTDIGHWALVLDYDPGVLTYQGAAPAPPIGGTFTATNTVAGRIIMSWTGPATSLADSSTLVNLTFLYNNGESALMWYDNGSSCKYAASSSDSALYDKPKAQFYYNGYIGPNPLIANFTANNLMPAVNQTITLTDLSAGNPTSLYWTITPESYQFMNGTNAGSQNPQVKFTTNGAYTVTLQVYRGILISTKLRNEYIHAGVDGLWTGLSSSSWTETSNWHNYRVPGSTTDVTIPATAPNWPIVAHYLNVGGSDCQSITLEPGSQLLIVGSRQ